MIKLELGQDLNLTMEHEQSRAQRGSVMPLYAGDFIEGFLSIILWDNIESHFQAGLNRTIGDC